MSSSALFIIRESKSQIPLTSSAEMFVGRSGNDTIDGGAGNDSIFGGNDHDVIKGGNNNDSLYGGFGNDDIKGESGNDRIYGNANADTLDGGAGRDTLTGGSQNDTFVFSSLSHSTDTSKDVIADFNSSGTDKIDLTGLGFTGVQSGAGFDSTIGYTHVGGNTIIDDADSTFAIQVTGIHTLTASDFIF